MLKGATSFNKIIGDWNVSSIVTMVGMFKEAESFNQAIGGWNTSTVTDMRFMFQDASSFNQSIEGLEYIVRSKVGWVTCFLVPSSFNQPVGDWNVSSIVTK